MFCGPTKETQQWWGEHYPEVACEDLKAEDFSDVVLLAVKPNLVPVVTTDQNVDFDGKLVILSPRVSLLSISLLDRSPPSGSRHAEYTKPWSEKVPVDSAVTLKSMLQLEIGSSLFYPVLDPAVEVKWRLKWMRDGPRGLYPACMLDHECLLMEVFKRIAPASGDETGYANCAWDRKDD